MKKRIVTATICAAVLSAFQASAAETAVEKIRLFDNAGEVIYYNYEEILAKPVVFVNNSGEAFNTKVLTAKFENDRLCDVKISPITVPKGVGEARVDAEIILSTDCEVRIALLEKNSFNVLGDMFFYKSVPEIPQTSGGYASLSGYSRELQKAIKKLDESMDGKEILDLYASLYDAETGMFYSCISGKYSYGFNPNIEATSQIYDFVRGAGNLPDKEISQRLSDSQKQKMLKFLTDMYDPETGNFYHSDAPKGVASTGRVSRDNNWAKNYILKQYCGIDYQTFKANYPNTEVLLPQITLLSSASTQKATLTVTDKYIAATTIQECDAVLEEYWSNTLAAGKKPYSMGDTFGGLADEAVKKDKAAGGEEYYKALAKFVVSKQNPETGLWGDGVDYSSSSAAMKFAGFFKGVGEGYRYYDKMVENCIKVILSDAVPQYIVYIWNPLSAMQQARNNFKKLEIPVPKDFDERIIAAMPDIVSKSLEKIKKFKKPDGGYSYEDYFATVTIQSIPTGLGLCESDVDGTGKMRGVKSAIYSLLSLKSSAILSGADISEFFAKLQSAQHTIKNTNKTYINDFEHYDVSADKKPDEWTEGILNTKRSGTGTVRAVKDPVENDKCVMISGDYGERMLARIGGFSLASENGKVQTVEFDIFVPGKKKQYYYISLGNSPAVRMTLNYAKTGDNVFTLAGKELADNMWHNIKIEYLYDDGAASVKFYIGGEYVKDLSCYETPKKSIACFTVSGIVESVGEIYIDNLKAYVK